MNVAMVIAVLSDLSFLPSSANTFCDWCHCGGVAVERGRSVDEHHLCFFLLDLLIHTFAGGPCIYLYYVVFKLTKQIAQLELNVFHTHLLGGD